MNNDSKNVLQCLSVSFRSGPVLYCIIVRRNTILHCHVYCAELAG